MHAQINRQQLEGQLLTALDSLENSLISSGVNYVAPAPQSIQKFLNAPVASQNQIIANITKYLDILAQEPEIIPKRRNIEANRLRRALDGFGLRAFDDNVFEQISDDDIVEFYSDMGVQLYRNTTFIKLCSYSLLDLAVNSWEDLYEKPASVVNTMQTVIQNLLSSLEGTREFGLAPFVQKEKFLYARTLRTYMVNPKILSPLVDIHSGKRTAFITTFKAEIIAEGHESDRFRII